MSIEQQVKILSEITQIMHRSAKGLYEEMRCAFEFEKYAEGWSVSSRYSLVRGGVSLSEVLDDPEDSVSGLVYQLHELMAGHTGGNWKNFVLELDVEGRATTRFDYV